MRRWNTTFSEIKQSKLAISAKESSRTPLLGQPPLHRLALLGLQGHHLCGTLDVMRHGSGASQARHQRLL